MTYSVTVACAHPGVLRPMVVYVYGTMSDLGVLFV